MKKDYHCVLCGTLHEVFLWLSEATTLYGLTYQPLAPRACWEPRTLLGLVRAPNGFDVALLYVDEARHIRLNYLKANGMAMLPTWAQEGLLPLLSHHPRREAA
jgi:hypothetical protein